MSANFIKTPARLCGRIVAIRTALCFLAVSTTTTTVAQERIDFNFDVKPILSDRCYICHGPDAERREGELRLDTKSGAFAESQTGDVSHVIKPGDALQSELLRRITSTDPDVMMPPPESNLSISKAETDKIKQWIQEGAEWKDHWSFIPVAAEVPVPRSNSSWPKNAVDHFVVDALTGGIIPSARAQKERLIRRVTFDLTGLPPTLDQIDAYLADTSEAAFEKVVDRLLTSEAYGERMTSEWLDVARYSDTYGYQQDRDRYVWPWRDWVIKAFNANMPYDKFVTEQVAGDLLPDATQDQILATTFNRLHPQKVEGGSVPEEFRVEYVADRAQTFSTAFLGLTMECARCHDHKYDPIRQKEYYQLYAFFNNIDEAGLYSYFTPSAVPTPTLLMPSESEKKSISDLSAKIARVERAMVQRSGDGFEAWLRAKPQVEVKGQIAHLDCEKQSGPNQVVPGKNGNALKLTGDDAVGTMVGNFTRYQPFSVSLWMNTPDRKERAVIFHRSRAWTDAASRGYQLLLEDGKLSASLIHFWPGNAIRVRAMSAVAVGEWQHVTITYDGSSSAGGLQIFVNGKQIPTEVVRDSLYKNITGGGGDNIAIGQRFRDNGFKNGLVDDFRVFDRQLTAVEVRKLAGTLEAVPPSKDEWLAYYHDSTKEAAAARKELQELRKKRCELQDRTTEIMVMRELRQQRETFVLARGAYDAPAAKVQMNTPAVLPELSGNFPRNRLSLARWLFSNQHPLTARVVVNRYWQLLFGDGLVRTPEDFGNQGALPTHPQLLDWLARDFMDHGWDVKRLLKQIVMSATYQQDSKADSELLQLDPENRLLARFPSYRLPAEMLRDNALAVSGLLVNKVGGPPARPYEVEASFKPVKRDKGEGLYRRSLYTYWKRTGPAPAMMTLDAAKRDVCRVKRERTSSPLQAFVVLNGPQFVEAARALAQKMLQAHGDNDRQVIESLFRTLISRKPSADELAVLERLHEQQRTIFTNDPKRADAYLTSGDFVVAKGVEPVELAAMTIVANTLLSLDEGLMKR
jgi:hypothetical protein